MINWCARHMRGALWLWTAVGIVLTLAVELLFLTQTGKAPFPALIGLAAVWMMAGAGALSLLASNRSKEPVRALNDDCDPEPLLRWGDEEMAYWQGKQANYRYIALCLMNRGVALSALGRFEEMHGMYLAVDENRMARLGSRIRMVYEFNRCACFLGLGRLNEAAAALRRAEDLAATLKKQDIPEVSLLMGRCELKLARGQTGGVETDLAAALAQASCEYQRVSVHMLMARLCQAEGKEGEAREHLRYVAGHGNKLAVRRTAEEALEQPL